MLGLIGMIRSVTICKTMGEMVAIHPSSLFFAEMPQVVYVPVWRVCSLGTLKVVGYGERNADFHFLSYCLLVQLKSCPYSRNTTLLQSVLDSRHSLYVK